MHEDCSATTPITPTTLTNAVAAIDRHARLPQWCDACQATYQWEKT